MVHIPLGKLCTSRHILVNIFGSKKIYFHKLQKTLHIKFCISGKIFALLVQTGYKLRWSKIKNFYAYMFDFHTTNMSGQKYVCLNMSDYVLNNVQLSDVISSAHNIGPNAYMSMGHAFSSPVLA